MVRDTTIYKIVALAVFEISLLCHRDARVRPTAKDTRPRDEKKFVPSWGMHVSAVGRKKIALAAKRSKFRRGGCMFPPYGVTHPPQRRKEASYVAGDACVRRTT